ncbi:hypothetical protein ACOSQ3_023434 [Xanthoceras sorbifolium]
MKNSFPINHQQLVLISPLGRKLSRSYLITIKRLRDLEAMLLKNYRKYHQIIGFLRTPCMIRTMTTLCYP